MTRILPKELKITWTLFIAVAALLSITNGLGAQERGIRPDKKACFAKANLFPKQARSGNFLKCIFPENAEITADQAGDLSRVAQRISITLAALGGEEIGLTFYWESAVIKDLNISWGETSGDLLVKADGNPNYFFLDRSPGLPINIPCAEFKLEIPPGVEIKEVLFSSLAGEEPSSEDCPMPGLQRQIGEAFLDSLRTPKDAVKTKRFLSLLEKSIPEYGCVSRYGGHTVPALFLADLPSIWNWLDYLYLKMDEENDYALRVCAGIYDKHPDGVLSEVMADHIEKIMHDRPLLVLRNWPEIRTYKRNILESRSLWGWTETTGLTALYSDIARKEPKYKTACDEIIRILDEEWLSSRRIS